MIALLHSGVKSIHVDMHDSPGFRHLASQPLTPSGTALRCMQALSRAFHPAF
jgi:hypothetical protein